MLAGIGTYIRQHHIGFLALFIALGGTAWALEANSVKSKHIVNGQVRSEDIGDGEVVAADVDTTSLQRRVTGSCPAGQAATEVSQGGSLTCADTGGAGDTADALYGDGSDGDQTIASNTTLNRDTYYHDLTVNPETTLNPGGFRIFVSGTLTMGDGAEIARNGSGHGSSEALESGTLGGSGAGGTAGPGESVINSLGGAGGATLVENGGAVTRPPEAAGGEHVFDHALAALSGRSLDDAIVNGGAGGGGEPGGASAGGGAGGGVVVVVARAIALDGSAAITADGGAAGTFGAPGGGGVVVVITTTAKPAGMTLSAVGGSLGPASASEAEPGFTAWFD